MANNLEIRKSLKKRRNIGNRPNVRILSKNPEIEFDLKTLKENYKKVEDKIIALAHIDSTKLKLHTSI